MCGYRCQGPVRAVRRRQQRDGIAVLVHVLLWKKWLLGRQPVYPAVSGAETTG